MKHDSTVPSILQNLEYLNRELNTSDNARALQQTERELLFLFDDLCAAYLEATYEERVDINVSFEFRGKLLELMVTYFENIAQQALKASKSRWQEKNAIQLLRQGVAANTIVGPRVPESDLEQADENMIKAADQIGFDMISLARELDIPSKYYVQRAIQYNKGKQRAQALKALGLALKSNPQLDQNEKVVALASTLTGESPMSAMITISEGYVLRKLIEDIERQSQPANATKTQRSRTTPLDVIRSWLS
jgi:tetratricopeptide (TPR) repeat protein